MAYFIGNEQVTEEEFYRLLPEIKAHAAIVEDYVNKVKNGEITLEEVPTKYYQRVYDRVNEPEAEPEEPIDPRQALIDEIIAEVNA
jgi:hypothetical protein